MEHEYNSHDSYDIDISNIKNSDRICWEYTKEPPLEEEERWFEATQDMYCKLSPITEALATSSDYVHLEKLKPSNILEWYYRLDSLFDAGLGFLMTETREGEIPIRITLSDLTDHLGLQIHTHHYSAERFDKCIRDLRMRNHIRELL